MFGEGGSLASGSLASLGTPAAPGIRGGRLPPRPGSGGVLGSLAGGGSPGGGGEAAALRREVRAAKSALVADRAEVARLRGLVVSDAALRGDLEEFFLQATEDLRKEGERERRRREGFGGGGGAGGVGSGQGGALLLDRQMEEDLAALFESLFPASSA